MKDSNPKAAFGDKKVPLGLVPITAIAEESLAFLEGYLKYGHVNWREIGAKASTYRHAHDRHMALWWEGEECDPDTGISHLASARACLAIIIDARAHGKLTDDRPKSGAFTSDYLAALAPTVARLRELHGDKNPRHYTIADNAVATTVVPSFEVDPVVSSPELQGRCDVCHGIDISGDALVDFGGRKLCWGCRSWSKVGVGAQLSSPVGEGISMSWSDPHDPVLPTGVL